MLTLALLITACTSIAAKRSQAAVLFPDEPQGSYQILKMALSTRGFTVNPAARPMMAFSGNPIIPDASGYLLINPTYVEQPTVVLLYKEVSIPKHPLPLTKVSQVNATPFLKKMDLIVLIQVQHILAVEGMRDISSPFPNTTLLVDVASCLLYAIWLKSLLTDLL